MLPPVDPAVLADNPKFGALYNDLCKYRLNVDGTSTLDAKTQQERDAFVNDLIIARTQAAKKDLVSIGLNGLLYGPDAIPAQLQAILPIVILFLDGDVPPEDQDIVQGDLEKFKDDINLVAQALSHALQHDASTLSRMLSSDSDVQNQRLLQSIRDLKQSIDSSKSSLNQARLDLTHETVKLHAQYRQIIESSIRILEQIIHGSASRAIKAKSDYLATVAEAMSKKLGVQHGQLMTQIYSNEMQDYLQSVSTKQSNESRSLRRKIGEAEDQLKEYHGTRGIEDLAGEYADLLAEKTKVLNEIAKLDEQE